MDGALNLLAIGIEKKFVRIKTMALLGSIRAIHPVSIQLAWAHFRQVAVPDHVRLLGKWDAKCFAPARVVKQTEFNFLGMF